MPAPKMRRPACFGWVAGPPRSTPTSIASSSRTRSTATSSARVEASSSALRKAWFWIVTCADRPVAVDAGSARGRSRRRGERVDEVERPRAAAAPWCAEVRARAPGRRARGRRNRPGRSRGRALSFCRRVRSSSIAARDGRAGIALGGGVDQLGDAQRPRAPVGQLVVDASRSSRSARSGAATVTCPRPARPGPPSTGARSSRLSTLPAPDFGQRLGAQLDPLGHLVAGDRVAAVRAAAPRLRDARRGARRRRGPPRPIASSGTPNTAASSTAGCR